MKCDTPSLTNELVTFEPADNENVELLIKWTLDPVAQGPYKRVPEMNSLELWTMFLSESDRQYFLIKHTLDRHPLGRFYWRAWRFTDSAETIDWELNVFLADPLERGKGTEQPLSAWHRTILSDLTKRGVSLPSRSLPILRSSKRWSELVLQRLALCRIRVIR